MLCDFFTQHLRLCHSEAEARYAEAKAASSRLADLKTQQVEKLRQQLVEVQTKEMAEVQRVYEEETRKFHKIWENRLQVTSISDRPLD